MNEEKTESGHISNALEQADEIFIFSYGCFISVLYINTYINFGSVRRSEGCRGY